MDDAAKAWGDEFAGSAYDQGKEMGSTFYQNGNGFSYTNPTVGTPTGCNPSLPENNEPITGIIHVHPYVPGHNSGEFSPQDTEVSDIEGVPGYLVTPQGNLKKYNNDTHEVTVISRKMPKDPLCPPNPGTIIPIE